MAELHSCVPDLDASGSNVSKRSETLNVDDGCMAMPCVSWFQRAHEKCTAGNGNHVKCMAAWQSMARKRGELPWSWTSGCFLRCTGFSPWSLSSLDGMLQQTLEHLSKAG